jgi:hypothetical protein
MFNGRNDSFPIRRSCAPAPSQGDHLAAPLAFQRCRDAAPDILSGPPQWIII